MRYKPVRMRPKVLALSRRYVTALRKHLKEGQQASLASAQGLGSRASAAGFQTLDLAILHENALVAELLPGFAPDERAALTRQAAVFFAAVIVSNVGNRHNAQETVIQKKFIETLSRRTVELAASNLELRREILQRKAVESALKKSERHHAKALEQSDRLQEQLRRLSRELLSAQENERKRISRELHDVVGQTLTGINIRLAALKKEATFNTRSLESNIARTQRLVEHSVKVVHRFARELRPAALDDIGLIPALHSFLKSFTQQTGVRASLTAFAAVEDLDSAKRTVLFRVAQEALANVARHAGASRVQVSIQKLPNRVCMKINDDGKSFDFEGVLRANRGKRLGLLGMRERLEMVGGNFDVESAPAKGTTVVAHLPFGKRSPQARKPAVKHK
jgi:signal transduction histidine kinase